MLRGVVRYKGKEYYNRILPSYYKILIYSNYRLPKAPPLGIYDVYLNTYTLLSPENSKLYKLLSENPQPIIGGVRILPNIAFFSYISDTLLTVLYQNNPSNTITNLVNNIINLENLSFTKILEEIVIHIYRYYYEYCLSNNSLVGSNYFYIKPADNDVGVLGRYQVLSTNQEISDTFNAIDFMLNIPHNFSFVPSNTVNIEKSFEVIYAVVVFSPYNLFDFYQINQTHILNNYKVGGGSGYLPLPVSIIPFRNGITRFYNSSFSFTYTVYYSV